MPFRLIKEALTACNAANLSFVMLLLNDVFQFMLRQSLDAQEITFSIRAICTETFSIANWKKLSNLKIPPNYTLFTVNLMIF